MKTNFKKMEDEMDHLANKMSDIVDSSTAISDTLQDRREELHKLNDVHTLLKKVHSIKSFHTFTCYIDNNTFICLKLSAIFI